MDDADYTRIFAETGTNTLEVEFGATAGVMRGIRSTTSGDFANRYAERHADCMANPSPNTNPNPNPNPNPDLTLTLTLTNLHPDQARRRDHAQGCAQPHAGALHRRGRSRPEEFAGVEPLALAVTGFCLR